MDIVVNILLYLQQLATTMVNDLTQPAGAAGAFFGLVGLMVQLSVRGEWPTGRLNEGSPKVIDPQGLVVAAFAAVAAGVLAATYLGLRTDHVNSANLVFSCTQYVDNSGLEVACKPKSFMTIPAKTMNIRDVITLICFGYVVSDLKPMTKRVMSSIKRLLAFLNVLPSNSAKS
ncbi:hypothetical protein [Rhizobium leguminosarum]|uniref:hypothetical protein n=1 Tax=Rhizobium leguminosarum TaxID=384 RepID=UPI00140FAEA7|nr:hypothetical protein [Rhizobium leguminosarum]QIO61595.1 hypothetical protein HA463_28170 [Rhizobium leguminosarum bv. trifolii]